MTDGIIVTTKDKLESSIQNDEKSIIIRGKLAEDIQKRQTIKKVGIISLFVLSASLLIVPFVRMFLYQNTLSVSTFQNNDNSQSSTIHSLKRQSKNGELNLDEDKKSTIDQITEYAKKDIFSINLGLGLLVILSICSFLHKIIDKYDEIHFKAGGKFEIHLVHK